MEIGFVGLGTMGGRMVRRLIRAGHQPLVYDVVEAARGRLVADGAREASSVRDLVERADVVLSSLPMPRDVEEVYTGAAGAHHAARAGQIFADLSTIDPSTARRVATALAERGAHFLDAPVSGGPVGVDEGTLAVMVGGDAAALDQIRPILEAFARRIIHVGPVGAGTVVKLANQLLVGANTIAALEAVAFAERSGIAPALLLEVLSASAGDSVMLRRSIREFVLTEDYTAQFALRLLVKDLRLYVEEAAAGGAPLATGRAALARFEQALAAGLGDEDYAAVWKLIREGEKPDGTLRR